MLRRSRKRIERRRLLLGGAAAGLGALAAGARDAVAQQSTGAEFLDYDPPRPWAAGARVGNLVFLAGETARDANGQPTSGGIAEQAELVFQNIQRSLRRFGTDTNQIIKMTTYLRNWEDLELVRPIRARYLTRPVPATTVVISRLSEPQFLIEIDVTAYVPDR
jgi:enamine deaminase RidA (YjgF/YER057c/UK114 family)